MKIKLTGILAMAIAVVQVADAQTLRIEIDAAHTVRKINPFIYGINTARWDESLFPAPWSEMLETCDRDAIGKIKTSGVTLLKYPGGNDADSYVWNSKENSESEMNTDEYIALCREVGAEPFITVNFNAGPALAAEWVRYCNVDRKYGVKYWEVGDEQWGTWAKGHSTPEAYAEQYAAFVKAMKAVDPAIKVATNVPLGEHPENWTERVLRAARPYVDLLTFTYFPLKWGEENDTMLFSSVGQCRKLVLQLKSDVVRAIGQSSADSILLVNVGYNSVNHSPGPQTLGVSNALWTADIIGTTAETGIDMACFWALHNYYPPRDGDFGYLSSDGTNAPRYTYYVFKMLHDRLIGNTVAVSGTDSTFSVYAARHDKVLSVAVINKDYSAPKTLDLKLNNFDPSSQAQVRVLDRSRKDVGLGQVSFISDRCSLTIPPYSLVTLDILERDSLEPPKNLALSARCSASSYSTIGPNFKPSSAADGKMYSHWNSAAWTKSNGQEAQWFQLEWKSAQRFDSLTIFWGQTFATEYDVLISDDGQHWKTIGRVPEGKGGTEASRFPAVTARAIRIDGKKGTKGISAYSINEIQVCKTPQQP